MIGSLGVGGLSATTSPELAGYLHTIGGRSQQFTWTSPITNSRARRLSLRQHARALGAARHARQSDTRSGTSDRAMCGGLRGKRRHRGTELSFSELAEQLGGRAQLARVSIARHRRAQPQVRVHRDLFIDDRKTFGNSLNLTYRVNNGVPNGVTQSALPMELHQRTRYNALLRPGTVDDLAHDAAGRAPVRPVLELLSATDASTLQLPAVHGELSRDSRRHGLQQPLAAFRRRLRPLRQRQDGAQVQHGEIPGGLEQRRGLLLDDQSDQPVDDHVRNSDLERSRRQLLPRLRPVEHVAESGMRPGEHQLRQGSVHDQRGFGGPGRMGRAAERLGHHSVRAARAAARGYRWKSATRGVGSSTSLSPTT